jgi:hypothetical protein
MRAGNRAGECSKRKSNYTSASQKTVLHETALLTASAVKFKPKLALPALQGLYDLIEFSEK